jgi:hypothetical protein
MSEQTDRVADLEREVAELRDQRDRAWMELQAMRRSLSWPLTCRRCGRGRSGRCG